MSRDREPRHYPKVTPEDVNDTPPGGIKDPKDALLYKYLAGESIPPPPPALEAKAEALSEKMRSASRSGSWQLETFQAELRSHYESAFLVAIERERTAAEKRRADAAEAVIEKRADWWRGLAQATLAPVLAAAILSLAGIVFAAFYFFSHHTP